MPNILLTTLADALGGPVPVDAVLDCTASRFRTVDDRVTAPKTVTVKITNGVPESPLILDESGVDWYWTLRLKFPRLGSSHTRHVAVPANEVEWADLVDIDRATMQPDPGAVPAWEAAVTQVQALIDNAQTDVEGAVGDAVAVQVPVAVSDAVTVQVDPKVQEAEQARAGAVAAQVAAEAVPAQVSTAMSEVLADPEDPFTTQLFANIADVGGALFAPLSGGATARFRRHVPEVLTSFQTGHGWTAVSGGGTTSLNDTADSYAGTQSVKMVTSGAGASQIIGSAAVAPLPAGHFYRIWVKVDAPETLARLRLFASDEPGFTKYYSIEATFSSSATAEVLRKWKAGEWVPIDMPLISATVTGTPNAAALTHLRVLANDRNIPATVHIGRVDYVPLPGAFPGGVVSLTYDDSWASAYTEARKVLAKYGYTATIFPIIERIDQAGYLSTAQLLELVREYGWEVGGHATTYAKHVQSLDGMTQAERRAELGAIRAWMQQNGITSSTFAYPNGRFDKATVADLAEYFTVGRMATGRYLIPDELTLPSLPLRVLGMNGGTNTVTAIKDEVDRAAASGTWVVLMFHDIVSPEGTSNDCTPAEHAEIVDYIASVGADCRSMQEVMRAYAAF